MMHKIQSCEQQVGFYISCISCDFQIIHGCVWVNFLKQITYQLRLRSNVNCEIASNKGSAGQLSSLVTSLQPNA